MRIYSSHNILIAAGRLNLTNQKSKRSEPWVGERTEFPKKNKLKKKKNNNNNKK